MFRAPCRRERRVSARTSACTALCTAAAMVAQALVDGVLLASGFRFQACRFARSVGYWFWGAIAGQCCSCVSVARTNPHVQNTAGGRIGHVSVCMPIHMSIHMCMHGDTHAHAHVRAHVRAHVGTPQKTHVRTGTLALICGARWTVGRRTHADMSVHIIYARMYTCLRACPGSCPLLMSVHHQKASARGTRRCRSCEFRQCWP